MQESRGMDARRSAGAASDASRGRRILLTKSKIADLPPATAGRRARYYDAHPDGRGLELSVTSAGVKTWYLVYRFAGRPESCRLGRWPDLTVAQARQLAIYWRGEIAKGRSPRRERRLQAAEPTLADAWRTWLDLHGRRHLRPRSLEDAERIWRLHLAPLAARRLSEIGQADVQRLHARIGAHAGHRTANKAVAVLRAVLNRARRWGLLAGANPAAGIDLYPQASRERYLTADEVPRFLDALADEPNRTVRDFLLLALLTGQRKRPLLRMRWDQINLDAARWTIPAGEMKGKVAHVVPLVPEAMDVLWARMRGRPKDSRGKPIPWVFPACRRGRRGTGHLVSPGRCFARICRRAEIEGLTIHDLRRTLGSWQAAQGSSLLVIGQSLAHRDPASTAIYARLGLDPVRQSMESAVSAMMAARGGRQHGDDGTAGGGGGGGAEDRGADRGDHESAG